MGPNATQLKLLIEMAAGIIYIMYKKSYLLTMNWYDLVLKWSKMFAQACKPEAFSVQQRYVHLLVCWTTDYSLIYLKLMKI